MDCFVIGYWLRLFSHFIFKNLESVLNFLFTVRRKVYAVFVKKFTHGLRAILYYYLFDVKPFGIPLQTHVMNVERGG